MTKILYSSFVILWAYYGLTFEGLTFEGLTLTKILYSSFVLLWAYYGLTFEGLTLGPNFFSDYNMTSFKGVY